jgi:hypothetical protein
MPKASRSPDPPLVCQRQFEPHRMQHQLWSKAYEQLVPQGRHRPEETTVRRGKKLADASDEASGFPKGRCA